jgi:Trk-type K+ transport system membrane component
LLFETVSAFSTCGLSTGACTTFSWEGKAILVANMYIGRIGTLTLAFALSRRLKESRHQYPETYFMVG